MLKGFSHFKRSCAIEIISLVLANRKIGYLSKQAQKPTIYSVSEEKHVVTDDFCDSLLVIDGKMVMKNFKLKKTKQKISFKFSKISFTLGVRENSVSI